jgi:transcriptional regulator with XRE-family HTH domain
MRGGSVIRAARRRAGITQKELARRLGTSQSVVARWESGRVSPTVETLSRVVRACGLNLVISLRPADDHDVGLALESQKLTPAQRLDQLTATVRFGNELRAAR